MTSEEKVNIAIRRYLHDIVRDEVSRREAIRRARGSRRYSRRIEDGLGGGHLARFRTEGAKLREKKRFNGHGGVGGYVFTVLVR